MLPADSGWLEDTMSLLELPHINPGEFSTCSIFMMVENLHLFLVENPILAGWISLEPYISTCIPIRYMSHDFTGYAG